MSKRQIRQLIETVYQKGESNEDGLRAIKTLAGLGDPAIRQLIATLANPPESDLHPIDLWESIHRVFWEFARTDADSLMDLMEKNVISPHYGYSALGAARGQRSIDFLVIGLKHRNPFIRWQVAETLVQRRNKRAVPALLEALNDRSDSVKSTVVFAMQSNRMYDREEAIPPLRRIVANKALRKSSPGTWQTARALLRRIAATG